MIKRDPLPPPGPQWKWMWCWHRRIGDYIFTFEWVEYLYTDKGDRNWTIAYRSNKLKPPEFHHESGQHNPEW